MVFQFHAASLAFVEMVLFVAVAVFYQTKKPPIINVSSMKKRSTIAYKKVPNDLCITKYVAYRDVIHP